MARTSSPTARASRMRSPRPRRRASTWSSPAPGRRTTSCPRSSPGHERQRRPQVPGDPPRAGRPRAEQGRGPLRRHHTLSRRRRPRLRGPARSPELGRYARGAGGVIHVYGVVDGLEELPRVLGVDEAPLERRRVAGLELVLSRAETPPSAEVSRETVLRHAQVVEALMRRSAAILPAQLGRAFRDEDQLATAIEEQAVQLERSLERVRDRKSVV